jgi:hypothetical protein
VKKILPEIDDLDPNDTWTISIENFASKGLYQFTSFSYPSLIFTPWDSSHAGFYHVTLVLKDNYKKVSKYSFNLIISDPLFTNNSPTLSENKVGDQIDNTETIEDLDSNIFKDENDTSNMA